MYIYSYSLATVFVKIRILVLIELRMIVNSVYCPPPPIIIDVLATYSYTNLSNSGKAEKRPLSAVLINSPKYCTHVYQSKLKWEIERKQLERLNSKPWQLGR